MAKDMMLDLEKGIQEGMDAPAHKVPVMTEDDDQGDLVLDELVRVHHQIEGGTVAGKINPAGQKNWGPPYWLLVAAASVIVLAPTSITKDLMFPPELAMFAVLQCAICLILRAMKQMV